ncbi:Zinc finger protein zfp-1 [Podila epicladia]|nr:Zinc finger protein zfp-1 [Podila epicladia]
MSSNESSPPSTPAETDCLVCGSGKSYSKNKILFCDGPGCDIPVHQNCYGVAVVPEGDWYCERCEDKVSIEDTPSCCCPQRTGAFKRTNIPNQYIHVACARLHPSLDDEQDPIVFDTSLTKRNICCLCNSDFGVCSKCNYDDCERMMHVTCAQAEALVTKGKDMYCEDHRDQVVLNKIMESKTRNSSTSSNRSSKRSRNYAETSSSETDPDEDENDEDEHNEGGERDSDDDVDMDMDASAEYSERKIHRRKSSNHSSTSSKGHSKNRNSIDSTNDRRRKAKSSESEEIEVDDEAVLGSGGGGYSSGQRKRVKGSQPKGPRASAEESQRQRLFSMLDKNKRKQSSSGPLAFSGLGSGDLSNLVIRTAGGPLAAQAPTLGSPASIAPNQGGDVKKKLPGVNRHGYNSSSLDTSPGGSPSLASFDRFPGNGGHLQHGRNHKGLSFEVDPTLANAVSGAPSPALSNFSNASSPMQARMNQPPYQQRSPRTAGPPENTKEMQSTIQMLQAKVSSLENALQSRASDPYTPPSSLAQANPHTMGTGPGQDLQYKFDVLQHSHAQEKIRNMNLRQNLRDLFAFMQIPVQLAGSDATQPQETLEFNSDKLEYVQALRDTIVGPDSQANTPASTSSTGSTAPRRVGLDPKKRDFVVDKVLKELAL